MNISKLMFPIHVPCNENILDPQIPCSPEPTTWRFLICLNRKRIRYRKEGYFLEIFKKLETEFK